MSQGVKTEFDADRILVLAEKGSLEALKRAGAYVRRVARNSIHISERESQAGSPPHSRHGALKRSILFGVDKAKMTVYVGSAASLIGTSGSAHESGGKYRQQRYPKRPFMAPALGKSTAKLPALWKNAVK